MNMDNEKNNGINGANDGFVTGLFGPKDTFTAEYQGGVLKIGFPADLWTYGYARLTAAAREMFPNEKPKEKFIVKGVAEWIFMLSFDWIREFPVTELETLLECSTGCLVYTRKVLEYSGMCVIGKEKHFGNRFSMARGQGCYEWTPVLPPSVGTGSQYDTLTYYVKETSFDGMFSKYAECFSADEYVSSKREGWGMLDKNIYESPYYDLHYRFSGKTFKARLFECYWVDAAVSRFGVPPLYKYRLYNGFHYLPHVLRKNLFYEGNGITELFDLHCSFYTISAGLILERYPDIKRDKLNAFFWDCITGKLYDKCSKELDIPRDIAKFKLQGWRNLFNKGTAHSSKFGYSYVSEFMEKTYPEISEIYYNWPTYANSKGETVKALQRDLSEYETKLMSKLAFEIEDKYNVKCFLLHDAIYVSEKDKAEKMPADIEKKIFNWFEDNILH